MGLTPERDPDVPLRVLVVCTANICRSPTAERLLRSWWGEALVETGWPRELLATASAGVDAVEGRPDCPVAVETSTRLLGTSRPHRSRPLAPALVRASDLVLTADRSHRSAVISLVPAAAPRTFTLRQAARLADQVVNAGVLAAAGGHGPSAGSIGRRALPADHLVTVPRLTGGAVDRLRWFVSEIDAVRGLGVVADPGPGEVHPDDIPDPHHHAGDIHPVAFALLTQAVRTFAELGRAVLRREPAPGPV